MKKNLSRILAAFLILCMLPATFITAFARGKGVYGDLVENQSLNNAPGQYIPETITVDGVLNDTGWPESGFSYVDSNTGYWNVEDVKDLAGKNADATYKYQIRSDIEQLYVGATLTVPKLVDGQDEVIFHIFMKDANSTSTNVGYTDTITFTVNVANKTATVSIGPGKTAMSTVENGTLPAEAHQFVSKFSTDAEGNCVVTLEMRNKIANMVEDISAVTYYVALYLPTGNITAAGNPEYNQLVHPKVAYTNSSILPTSDYWPTNADGSAGGVHIDTTMTNSENDIPREVTVDGNFDESVWSDLTNFHIHDEDAQSNSKEYASLNGDTLYGTGVKYSNENAYLPLKANNAGYMENYNSKDNPNRDKIRFKYELRVDGDYLYGAVVAYVPPIKTYTEADKTLGSVNVVTSPDLNVYFFSNQRNDIERNGDTQSNEVALSKTINNHDGYLPETIVQIRSLRPDYTAGGAIHAVYANIWVDKYFNDNDKTKPSHIAWGNGMVNDEKGFQGSRSECLPGNLWNFEFKIDIDKVPKTAAGDIVFSIAVYDRYAITPLSGTTTNYRANAFTGSSANGDNYGGNVYPQYAYDRNKDINKITAQQISDAAAINVTEKTDFTDKAELDQAIWAALSGADNFVNGRLKNTTALNSNSSFAYKLSADYEYIYGAVLLNDSWKAEAWLKLNLNRKKTYEELKAANFVDEDNSIGRDIIKTYSVNSVEGATNEIVEWTNGVNDTAQKDSNRTRLSDGVYQAANWGPDNDGFSTWQRKSGGTGDVRAHVDLTLTDLFTTKKIDAYFAGGDKADQGQWGIYIPKNVKIFYSLDGVEYKEATATLVKTKEINDTSAAEGSDKVVDDYFHGYKYAITLEEYISARYIRLDVTGDGGFIWMSEVDVFVTETHGEYYSANMRIYNGKNGIFTHNNVTQTVDENDFKYEYVSYGNGARAVEFRISLETLGIDYDLSSKELDEIFAYYISVEEVNGSGVQHPRNDSGQYIIETSNWTMTENYDGCNVFTYGDMSGNITVDGKLDEMYWIGNGKDNADGVNKKLEMQHVDATNGTWKKAPTKGNTLSYDYKIYADRNYLYGAAIIDVSAIAAAKAYEYENVPITRFDIWIDNRVDEYNWINDGNNKTNINVSVDKSRLENGAGNEPNGYNGSREYDVQYYTNYYYNIYLCEDNTLDVRAGSGDGKTVCGGSTPNHINDPDREATDPKVSVPIDETNWSWGMSTVNGVTYVEFMIKLDNVYCTDAGINYYVSATHSFGTETADTSDDETLTLVYPAISEVSNYEPLWVTHINSVYNEGSGVLFTYDYVQTEKYRWEAEKLWWGLAILRPTGVADQYEIVDIRNGLEGENAGKIIPYTKEETVSENSSELLIQPGDLIYGINYGNDYIHIQNYKDALKEGETDMYAHITADQLLPEKHGGKNYTSEQCNAMINTRFLKWTVGDVIKLNLADNVKAIMNNNPTGHDQFLAQTGMNFRDDGAGDIIDLKWYDPTYVSDNSFAYISRSEQVQKEENNAYIVNVPTTANWDKVNAAKIKPLEHFAPEVIKIDGLLNEAGWDDDRWIYVIETANGTLEQAGGVIDTLKYQPFFKYQLRTDGEYLYVGAEYPAINYADYNMPSFTLWIKSDSEANTWTHKYEIAYSKDGSVTLSATDTQIADSAYIIDGESPALIGPTGEITDTTKLAFANKLSFDENGSTTPNGLNSLIANGEYGDSALYGYTEEVQENQTSGEYYPTIKTEKIYLGKESAVMKALNDDNKAPIVVEFKIALEEFGAATLDANGNIVSLNDFEYYVEAAYSNYDLFYPVVYTKSETENNARLDYFPMWEWDSKNAAKVTVEDLTCGAMRMRNNCNPVVTLGAKISDNYIAPDNGETCKAIRFGALYTEDYLRNWAKTDAASVDESNEMYTASTNDYWDVAEVGIAVLPTMLLGDKELTLETPDIFTAPADNIVNWQDGDEVEGGWSNFADYENFVFYITIWGIEGAEDMKFSFCPYVDFYASAGTDTYYGETFIRSYNMINNYTMSEEGTEDDTSEPVLPDSSENPPPAENHPQESENN